MIDKKLEELLKNKTNIKMKMSGGKYIAFSRLCNSLDIQWNATRPHTTPAYVFVTNHKMGYVLTYTTDDQSDVLFYKEHKAQEIEL